MGLMIVLLIIDMMVPQGLAVQLGFLNVFWMIANYMTQVCVFINSSFQATTSYANLIADLR